MNGMLNVYKEKGFTSHDVVAKLRGILKMKKIGHTGTLDPNAEGVLPICLGNATKLCDLLTEKEKIYQAELILGMTTDTDDITGKVLTKSEVKVPVNQVKEAIATQIGDIDQIPPMYSARKVQGKKLYELARQGKVIQRNPKKVKIYDIKILDIELPKVKLEIRCGGGTYIRSICRDVGEILGCGGVMGELLRTTVSECKVEHSLRLGEIEQLMKEQKLETYIMPVDEVFSDCFGVTMKEEANPMLYNGNQFRLCNVVTDEGKPENQAYVRVYDSQKVFQAVYQFHDEGAVFKPYKMFLDR